MARIRRAQLGRGFTTLSNDIVQSTTLTFRAKGLLLYLLSLPDNFVLRVNTLVDRYPEGKHIIYQTLEELKNYGLIDRVQYRDEKGKISSWDYLAYDAVQVDLLKKYGSKNQLLENWKVEENSLENDLHLKDQEIETLVVEEREIEENSVKNDLFLEDLRVEDLFPENQPLNNKYSKNKYNKKTAAERSQNYPTLENAAADFFVNENVSVDEEKDFIQSQNVDKYIAGDLTKTQKQQVWQTAKEYSKQHRQLLGGKYAEALYAEICHDLVDQKSWTRCGNDFELKFNVIKKHIRAGKWKVPQSLVKDITKSGPAACKAGYTAEVAALSEQYSTLLREAEDCYYFLNGTIAERDVFVKRKEQDRMKKILQEISPVQQALRTYGVLEAIESNFPLNLKAFIPRDNQSTKTQEALSC